MAVAFDEMSGAGRRGPARLRASLSPGSRTCRPDVLDYRRREAELLFRRIGITFAVYGEADAQERLIPFDIIPRILSGAEWAAARARPRAARQGAQRLPQDIYGTREMPARPASSRRTSSSRTRPSGRR